MEQSIDTIENRTSKPNLIYYDSAAKYWSQIPATIEGMLGGFGFISRTDIKGSQCFLKHLFKMSDPPGRNRAADCGAGIGRVTKNLLIKFFNQVDLVEQNPTFLEEAKSFIGAKNKTVNCFNVGLQDFSPELDTYDVIWSQWVLGHLTDEDLVTFFKSCKRGLRPGGVMVVKENLTSSDKVEVDHQDSSVTRPPALFAELYERAGLRCIYRQTQSNFPKGIYQVVMFAFRPAEAPPPAGDGRTSLAGDGLQEHPTGMALAEDMVQKHPTEVLLIEDNLQGQLTEPTSVLQVDVQQNSPMGEHMQQECPTASQEAEGIQLELAEHMQHECQTGLQIVEGIQLEPAEDMQQGCHTGLQVAEDMQQEFPTGSQVAEGIPLELAEDMQQGCHTVSQVAEDMQQEFPTGSQVAEGIQLELAEDMQQECPTLPVERTQQKCEHAS